MAALDRQAGKRAVRDSTASAVADDVIDAEFREVD
jgi:hypothetical protein